MEEFGEFESFNDMFGAVVGNTLDWCAKTLKYTYIPAKMGGTAVATHIKSVNSCNSISAL